MNYTHRKPYIPPAPALPRFALPSDGTDDSVDPLDSAATAQRPTLTTSSARRVVRRRALAADSTEEVQVEDILLEAYAEDPPPPPSRGVPSLPTSVTMASATASNVPPPRAQSAAVDELLRASAPEFAAAAPQSQRYPSPYGASAYGRASMPSTPPMRVEDYEAQSISPMMLAPTTPPAPLAQRSVPERAPRRRGNRGVALAIWSFVIMLVGVAAGAAIVIGVRDGTYARLREAARSAAARATEGKSAPTAEAAAAAPATPAPAAPLVEPAPVQAPAPPIEPVAAAVTTPEPAGIPTVSVDSLSEPAIPAGSTLVTFPRHAQGHRVFVDGRPIAVAHDGPTKLKCGRRLIKIGSGRRARATNLACGRAVTLK